MGRPREFNLESAITAATRLFIADGYEGCSMDRLVKVTGIHRGSLYAAFGSKRGIFLQCLRTTLTGITDSPGSSELLLVALGELAGRDDEIRGLCAQAIEPLGDNAAHEVGTQLLARAGLNEGHA